MRKKGFRIKDYKDLLPTLVGQRASGLEKGTSTIIDKLPPVYPSPFDTIFTGPTAIIVRSNIENLHFRPKLLTFRNPNDMFYYRKLKATKNLRQITFFNAYKDRQKEISGEEVFRTPFNQEHKIDFEMVISQWDWSEKTRECTWMHTPLTFDPPLNNGGGGRTKY